MSGRQSWWLRGRADDAERGVMEIRAVSPTSQPRSYQRSVSAYSLSLTVCVRRSLSQRPCRGCCIVTALTRRTFQRAFARRISVTRQSPRLAAALYSERLSLSLSCRNARSRCRTVAISGEHGCTAYPKVCDVICAFFPVKDVPIKLIGKKRCSAACEPE